MSEPSGEDYYEHEADSISQLLCDKVRKFNLFYLKLTTKFSKSSLKFVLESLWED